MLQEVDLSPLEALAGFVGACVADAESGMVVLSIGEFDFELAAAMNAEVLKAKRRAVRGLRLDDEIEDILISLGKQYHLIRPLSAEQSLFTYLVLDRTQASLGLARVALRNLERQDA
ncbi:MAG: roadblock/LC7 domain-containing protein [Rhodobacteraceae bacterium]|nr:roadblock/LC7 domain-containing protein [Paracoccaceae bacterium]